MAKPALVESQCPPSRARAGYGGYNSGAPRRGGAGPHGSAPALRGGWAVVNSLKDANGTPKPSSDVNCTGTRDRLRGASPTNGLWRRSTRSTPGAGLTAGANRMRRARTRGEGVQASQGVPDGGPAQGRRSQTSATSATSTEPSVPCHGCLQQGGLVGPHFAARWRA